MILKEMNVEKELNKEITSLFKRSQIGKKLLSFRNEITFTDFFSNRLLMISLIREGVPYSLFSLIKDYTPFTESEWSGFLEISAKSLQRYKQSSKHFKSLQSEKIIEMAEVTNIGLDIFGGMEKFKLWLNTPNFSLGGSKPIELLKHSYGKEMVVGELTRINHGILA